MVLDFSDAFWGDMGFHKLHGFMQAQDDVMKTFQLGVRALMDEEKKHTEKMKRMIETQRELAAKNLPSDTYLTQYYAGIFHHLKTHTEIRQTVAQSVVSRCDQILVPTHKALKKRLKELYDKHKKISEAYHKFRIKEKRSREHAHHAAATLEQAHQELHRAKNSTERTYTDRELAKMQKDIDRADKEYKKADAEHVKACGDREIERLRYERQEESVLEAVQEIYEEVISNLKQWAFAYIEIHESSEPSRLQACKAASEIVLSLDSRKEFDHISDKVGTSTKRPIEILYTVWEEDLRTRMAKGRRQVALNQRLQHFEDVIRKQENVLEGLLKIAKAQDKNMFSKATGGNDSLHFQKEENQLKLQSAKAVKRKLEYALNRVNQITGVADNEPTTLGPSDMKFPEDIREDADGNLFVHYLSHDTQLAKDLRTQRRQKQGSMRSLMAPTPRGDVTGSTNSLTSQISHMKQTGDYMTIKDVTHVNGTGVGRDVSHLSHDSSHSDSQRDGDVSRESFQSATSDVCHGYAEPHVIAVAPPLPVRSTEQSTPTDTPEAETPANMRCMLYNFEPTAQGEVAATENEMVTIVDDSDPDWIAVLKSDGQQGYVPKLYVDGYGT
eukprot:Clim_evm40s251 gene=Clim_evmTU40s251